MNQISRARWRKLPLVMLLALVVHGGCELAEPPGSSTVGGDGMGMQLIYPPSGVPGPNKAASDTLELQLYYLSTDTLTAIERRPVFDDSRFAAAADIQVIGGGSAAVEIGAVFEPSLWRVLARTGTLQGHSTFQLNPTELRRNVRIVLAETERPDAIVVYDSFSGNALSEPAGLQDDGSRMIYPIGVANEAPLTLLDFRFVLAEADSVTLLVDLGSRLHDSASGDQADGLAWELRELGFVPSGVAYRLVVAAPVDDGSQGVIASGSDVLAYLVVDGNDLPANNLCIHPSSAFFQAAGADRVTAVLDPARCDPEDFPIMAAVTVAELGDDTFATGQMVTINWSVIEGWGDAVSIDVINHLTGAVCLPLGVEAADLGELDWPAARCSGPTAAYRIRVTDLASGAVGETQEPFIVGAVCNLAVTSPNGGETWPIGSTQTITWEATGDCGSTVRIYLRNEAICPVIADAAPNTGEFVWQSVEPCGELTSGYTVQIVDLGTETSDSSDAPFDIVPTCLPTVGVASQATDAWGVEVRDGLAYVADGDNGLKIIDVDPPTNPDLVGSTLLTGKAWSVAVAGNYAFVAADTAGLLVVDISAPSDPNVYAVATMSGRAFAVTVVGDYAYVAAMDGGLQIVDISQPAEPFVIASHDTPGEAWGVAVANSRAYVADGFGGGLQIFDVLYAGDSYHLGDVDTPGDASGVTVSGNIAYVADGESGVQVVNVQDPAQPYILADVATGTKTFALTHVRNHLYVADRDRGLQIVDVAAPMEPMLVDEAPTPGEANWVQVVGNLGYVADLDGGLRIIDVGCYTPATR